MLFLYILCILECGSGLGREPQSYSRARLTDSLYRRVIFSDIQNGLRCVPFGGIGTTRRIVCPVTHPWCPLIVPPSIGLVTNSGGRSTAVNGENKTSRPRTKSKSLKKTRYLPQQGRLTHFQWKSGPTQSDIGECDVFCLIHSVPPRRFLFVGGSSNSLACFMYQYTYYRLWRAAPDLCGSMHL